MSRVHRRVMRRVGFSFSRMSRPRRCQRRRVALGDDRVGIGRQVVAPVAVQQLGDGTYDEDETTRRDHDEG